MALIIKEQYLTFDDVLLEPRYSKIVPSEVNLSTKFSRNVNLEIPLVSSAMDTVTEYEMAFAMADLGGIGVIHKNLSIADQASQVAKVVSEGLKVAAAIGAGDKEFERASELVSSGVTAIVIDTAHGHSKGVMEQLSRIKSRFKVDVVAGNVATARAVKDLYDNGADAIKVGIGPGSICTTRVVSGVGVPQFSAIKECADQAHQLNIPIIADGGIKLSGDATKALAVGAHTVMMGSVFAGTAESPGDIENIDGAMFKKYRGMGSLSAMEKGSKDRYGQADIDDKKLVPEGVEGFTPYKGSVQNIVHQFLGGIKSGFGYIGSSTVDVAHDRAVFVKISASGFRESHPHSLSKFIDAPNYKG